MTRGETIRKLGNAIRAYRGATSTPPGAIKTEWAICPQPDKLKRIVELLGLLRFDKEEQLFAIAQIDNFKTYAEFEVWMKKL
jgi:hypothetical protein